MQELEDMLITDEGEFFQTNLTIDLGDKEDILNIFKSHKELLEFGHKYAMEDPIAYDLT